MGLFGGGGKYEMSPESKQLWSLLMQQYQGGTPDWMRQEYQGMADVAGARVRNWGASNLPAGVASGNLLGGEMQARAQAMQGLPGEAGRYRLGLLGQMGGIAGQSQYRPSQIGQLAGGIGGNLMKLYALMQMGKQGKGMNQYFDPDMLSQLFNQQNIAGGYTPQAPWQ